MAIDIRSRRWTEDIDVAARTQEIRRLQRLSGDERLCEEVVDLYLAAMDDDPNLRPSSKTAYRTDVRQFSTFMRKLGIGLMHEVDATDLEAWLSSMDSLQSTTLNRKISAVSELFKWARKHSLVQENPVETLDRPRKRRTEAPAVSLKDFERLFAVCETTTERGLLGVLYWAGLRRSEAASLTVGAVDISNRMIRVVGKGNHVRYIPIVWNLVGTLEDVLRVRGTENADAPLYVNRAGNPLTPANVNRWFTRWARRAGLEARGYTPHSCRHGFGSLLGAEGVASLVISALLGHQDPKTTQRYVHGSPEQLRRQLEQIEVLGKPPVEEQTQAKQSDMSALMDMLAELLRHSQEVRQQGAPAQN